MEFYKKQKYPDGDFYIELLELKEEFSFRINSYEDLWELTHLIDVLNNNGIKPTITIPNLLSCQADKRFKKNQSFGYKLVHEFLKNLKADFKVFHPHQEMCILLDNMEIIDNSKFVSYVLSKLNDKDITPTILLPDGGAYKWGVKLMDKIGYKGDVIAAAKNRTFVDNKSALIQQLPDYNFDGKDIFIIDDICVYGGTFKGLSKLLRERNCGKLYLAVSHMTVQNLGEDPVTNYFDTVFTTNSKFDEYWFTNKGGHEESINNLKIIKLF